MSQEQKQTSVSPFDCAVCSAGVYGSNSGSRICLPCKSFFKRHVLLPPDKLKCNQNGTCDIEATRRYFSASLPPCRACWLQKCLSVGMDQNSHRPRSASSPPLILVNKFLNKVLIKTSSFDQNVGPSTKQRTSDIDTKMHNDEMMFGRVRCSSDAPERQRQF